MTKNFRTMLLLGSTLAMVGIAYFAGVVRAGGAPTMHPLVYSGTLTDGSGAPVTTSHNIGLTLWDDAAMTGATHQACVVPAAPITPQRGRFTITLDDATCVAAVHAHPDVWVEVSVDGAGLGRTHVGATPYALEATHSLSADSASTASRLRTTEAEWCGFTAASYAPAAIGNYPNAHTLCAAVSGCNAATAHMCTASEFAHAAQMQPWPFDVGGAHPVGWISQGAGSYNTHDGYTINDCQGWTSNSAAYGAYYAGTGTGAGVLTSGYTACTTPGAGGAGYPILCCD